MSTSDVIEEPTPRPYIRIKVTSMGDAATGKSCLIKRYCEKKFVAKYISTIGVDFGVRQVSIPTRNLQQQIKVNFFDLSGHQDFINVRSEFYTQTQGVMLVYDVTSTASFKSLENWLKESHKHGARPYATVVCANKVDITDARVVSESEGRRWAESKGFPYFETSAKSGQNVDEFFHAIFAQVLIGLEKQRTGSTPNTGR